MYSQHALLYMLYSFVVFNYVRKKNTFYGELAHILGDSRGVPEGKLSTQGVGMGGGTPSHTLEKKQDIS